MLHNIDTLSGSLCVCKGRFSARAANPLQQIAYSLQNLLRKRKEGRVYKTLLGALLNSHSQNLENTLQQKKS